MSDIYYILIKSLVAIALVVLVDLLIEHIVSRKITSQKQKKKTKLIIRNILIICVLVFLAQIWIDKFSHFLAFVGFISAALTIAQKENIMNLTGGLIIMWRDAFAEGDFVSIKEYEGIVENLGIFYFTLEETMGGDITNKSGKIIKVPNYYITMHPFAICSFDNFFILNKKYLFKFTSDYQKIVQFQQKLEKNLTTYLHDLSKSFSNELTKEYNRLKSKGKLNKLTVTIKLQQYKHSGYALTITGHIPYKYVKEAYTQIDTQVVEFVKDDDVALVESE